MTESDPTLALACELIARPSVTPDDAGCQDLLTSRLAPLGFECRELTFGDTRNLWARRGQGGPLLVFAGHTDVVPPGPVADWDSDPFRPDIRDGLLYGRGAADMKGSLAAMVTACEQLMAEATDGLRGSVAFLITSDEEGPATDGTVRVMDWLREQGVAIDYCLVGEPSSGERLGDTIKHGRRGSLNGVLRLRGRQGHVAYPQHADNPIHRALPALAALARREWDRGNAHFPASSFQITNIHGGAGATNVIPGELEVWVNFRFNTEQSAGGLQEAVEQCLREHGVDFEADWTLSGAPFLTAAGELVEATQAAVAAVTGRQAALSTAGGTSDGRFIAPSGAQVVELGPVNASIHRVNEHVRVDDLAALSAIYAGVMRRLLA
jgi:succinyl-diaminopimelate desuccinylase